MAHKALPNADGTWLGLLAGFSTLIVGTATVLFSVPSVTFATSAWNFGAWTTPWRVWSMLMIPKYIRPTTTSTAIATSDKSVRMGHPLLLNSSIA